MMRSATAKRMDCAVVTCLRNDMARSWIRAYFSSGNRLPLVIATGSRGEWDKETESLCNEAARFTGGMVIDVSNEWEKACVASSRSAGRGRLGWVAKKFILLHVARRLRPKSWMWIDDDVEVSGPLERCFKYAALDSGFFCAQAYKPSLASRKSPLGFYSQKTKVGARDKLCWNSLVVFHNDANDRILDIDRDFEVEDDEIIFTEMYKKDPRWKNGFYDMSCMEWQRQCKTMDRIPVSYGGIAIHYTGEFRNNEVKRHWAAKWKSLPPAPFETIEEGAGKMGSNDVDAVDAVFVIGNGSKHHNEELRYALRSLDSNCKFIRNVYICGVCPSWVDRTKVRFLQWPDRFGHAKDANIIDKLRHACEQPDMAERVLFCSDDQFVTRKCDWEDFSPRYLRRYDPKDNWYMLRHRIWHTRLRDTMEKDRKRRISAKLDPKDVFYYQPHIWMQISKKKFLEYAKWCDYQHKTDTIIASGYFNYADAGGEPNFDHIFMGRNHVGGNLPLHVAYTDGSYASAMRYLKAKFPHPSRFEIK